MRNLFPPFQQGVYLDYAATAPVFLSVLDAMREYEVGGRGNPRRGLHAYAARASETLEGARATVAAFVGAEASNLVFTKSATEGLNLAIESFTKDLGPGDEVVHTVYDHNSAYLPLKRAAEIRGFALREAGRGEFDSPLAPLFVRGGNVRLVVLAHVSNVTGEVLPVAEIAKAARAVGAKVIVDGAQAVAHMPVNVAELGADAYAFSAHKMYGPMGIGAVAFSSAGFAAASPFILGGGMTEPGVAMLEAGTPNVTGAVGFAKACEELSSIGFLTIQAHERAIMQKILAVHATPPGVGVDAHSPNASSSIFSFSIPGIHPHDVAQVLADHGVAVRAGHHCAPHISRLLDPSGVVRVSIGLPTTIEDVDKFFEALKYVESLR